MRLNLRCGDDILAGYVNHDITRHRLGISVAHDLRLLPWPWASDSADEIRLFDVLEHLPEVLPAIDEAWRILGPGGVLHIRVPHYLHENAWIDPTHRRPFHVQSFDYGDPDTRWGSTYAFYTDRKWKVLSRDVVDGNVLVSLRPRKDVMAASGEWRAFTWEERTDRLLGVLAALPSGRELVLLDDASTILRPDLIGRSFRRFPESQTGGYSGLPTNDDEALEALARLRGNAPFFALAFPSFWWLTHYPAFIRQLDEEAIRVVETDEVIVYEFRS